jgi:hypothetical protein
MSALLFDFFLAPIFSGRLVFSASPPHFLRRPPPKLRCYPWRCVAELGFRPHGWDFSPFIPFRPVDLSIDRYYPPQSAPCGEFPLPTAVDLWWRFLGIFYFSVRLALGLLSGCSVAWIPYQHRWIKHLWSVVWLSFSIHSGREHFIRSFGISARYDFSLILRFEPEGEWFYLCRSRFPFLFFLIFLPPSHCNSCFWPVILLLRFVFLGVRFFGVHRLNREPHLTHIHGKHESLK